MGTKNIKVTVVTVIFGDRWKFLSRVVEAVMRDSYVSKLIIVDNGSKNKDEIRNGTEIYGERVIVLHQNNNLGSAGGFAAGLAEARTTDGDYVFILDDDCIPEEGTIGKFLDLLKLFPDEKVVLSANRYKLLKNAEFFYQPSLQSDTPRGTFFEVFSLKKIIYFLKIVFMHGEEKKMRGPFIPIIPTEGFIYGGAFIPIEAVRKADLPDASLFLYGDDIEYSWNIKNLGYSSYLCASPKLEDIDATFGENSSHLLGQFDVTTAPFRVYYRLRNMVRLSRKHSQQGAFSLSANIFLWVFGLFLLGLFYAGPTKIYFRRILLMVQAVIAGYYPHAAFTKRVESSFFS